MRLIQEDHKGFKKALSKETSLRHIFEEHDCHTSFYEGWESVKTRFPHLMAFRGGLATNFLGTEVVESDFSVLKYEKNSFRTRLPDLTVEGIMHYKQFGAWL